MAREMTADSDFMAVAVQNALEEEYGQMDLQRRQEAAQLNDEDPDGSDGD